MELGMKLLSTIESDSIDLILTDPPYFIGFDGGKGWDSQWKTEKEYLDWCHQWTQECVRVLKPNRMMVVFGTLKTDTFIHYKLNTNTIDDIDKLITISNGYINNDYSKYTLKEFESYIRGFISVGSNINLLTKKNEIMKINETQME